MMQAGSPGSPNGSALATSNAEATRIRDLERQLRLLNDEHQHELERKVELERTIENSRSQLRSLSAMRSADKRQTEVLRGEIDTLRGLLQARPIQWLMRTAIDTLVEGPSDETRARFTCAAWGEVEDAERASSDPVS